MRSWKLKGSLFKLLLFFFVVNNVGVSHYPEFFGNMKQEVKYDISRQSLNFQ